MATAREYKAQVQSHLSSPIDDYTGSDFILEDAYDAGDPAEKCAAEIMANDRNAYLAYDDE